ncbi:MAG: isoprenylcysteine carboxylmethyltransferase family protein, partial [Candidatus Thorarchaeota archaeon]
RIYYRSRWAWQKSEATQEKIQKQELGWAGVILFVGILGMFVSIIVYFIFPMWTLWFYLPFPSFIRWLGVILGISILPLLIWIHNTLGHYYAAELRIRDKHMVIMVGPYSRIRHPMYTVFILFSLSTILIISNLFVTIFAFLIIIMLYPISKREEQMLITQFGDQYREYMQRTGRFLPPLRRSKQNEGHVD